MLIDTLLLLDQFFFVDDGHDIQIIVYQIIVYHIIVYIALVLVFYLALLAVA